MNRGTSPQRHPWFLTDDQLYALLQEERNRPKLMEDHDDPTVVIMEELPRFMGRIESDDEVSLQDEA